jgi:hypothetical protein
MPIKAAHFGRLRSSRIDSSWTAEGVALIEVALETIFAVRLSRPDESEIGADAILSSWSDP